MVSGKVGKNEEGVLTAEDGPVLLPKYRKMGQARNKLREQEFGHSETVSEQ